MSVSVSRAQSKRKLLLDFQTYLGAVNQKEDGNYLKHCFHNSPRKVILWFKRRVATVLNLDFTCEEHQHQLQQLQERIKDMSALRDSDDTS